MTKKFLELYLAFRANTPRLCVSRDDYYIVYYRRVLVEKPTLNL